MCLLPFTAAPQHTAHTVNGSKGITFYIWRIDKNEEADNFIIGFKFKLLVTRKVTVVIK